MAYELRSDVVLGFVSEGDTVVVLHGINRVIHGGLFVERRAAGDGGRSARRDGGLDERLLALGFGGGRRDGLAELGEFAIAAALDGHVDVHRVHAAMR